MLKKIFIGLPCQVIAIRRMQLFRSYITNNYPGNMFTWPEQYPPMEQMEWVDEIGMVISIFCHVGYYNPGIAAVLADKPIEGRDITGSRITPETVEISIGDQESLFKVGKERIKKKALNGCEVCSDYTGSLADVSVDAKKSPNGGTWVISGTQMGAERLEQLLELKVLEQTGTGEGRKNISGYREKKENRSQASVGKYADYLPPRFYTDAGYSAESDIYDSLLQDFYMVKDIINNDLCVLCGMCEAVCPLDSIKLDGEVPQYNSKCSDEICGMCFYTCPHTFVMQGIGQRRLFAGQNEFIQPEMVQPLSLWDGDADGVSESADGGVLEKLLGYLISQHGYSGVWMLSHWNIDRIKQNLGGVEYGLLSNILYHRRRGGASDDG